MRRLAEHEIQVPENDDDGRNCDGVFITVPFAGIGSGIQIRERGEIRGVRGDCDVHRELLKWIRSRRPAARWSRLNWNNKIGFASGAECCPVPQTIHCPDLNGREGDVWLANAATMSTIATRTTATISWDPTGGWRSGEEGIARKNAEIGRGRYW